MRRAIASLGKLLVQVAHPPLRNPRFWIVQGLVVPVAVLHAAADLGWAVPPFGIPDFAAVTLFLVPIVYAALNFGLSGAFATAMWINVLSIADLALWDSWQDRVNDSVQLLVVIAVAVFVGQRVDHERQARHAAEEAEARTKTYARRLLQAHEEERRRIAHELHDDPLQSLIHLGRRLEALASAPELPRPIRKEASQVQAVATETAISLREIARGLRPPSLDDLGLVAAVRQLVSTVESHNGKAVRLHLTGHPRRLPSECELGLYRIAQEALNNVEKHSSAKHVEVSMSFRRDAVLLTVRDDGNGYTPRAGSQSLGLTGMRERATLLGGELQVNAAPGRGTIVEATIPVSQ